MVVASSVGRVVSAGTFCTLCRIDSAAEPVLGVLIDLDTRPMTELLIHHQARQTIGPRAPAGSAGPVVADWDASFTGALVRLLQLLDDPTALDLLGGGRLRELFYAIVEGPAGPHIRAAIGASAYQLAPVLAHMRENLDQPLGVEALAERAGMSRAAFDRQFRAVTSLSPLRYLKALRLNDAAMLIANGESVTDASMRVGYASPSQFSREFKRHFGATPREWAGAAASGRDPQAFATTERR